MSERAQLALLLEGKAHDQRHRRGFEPRHFRAVGIERRTRGAGGGLLVGKLAQRGLDRRPHPLLARRQIEPLLDAGDLGIVEHGTARVRRPVRLGAAGAAEAVAQPAGNRIATIWAGESSAESAGIAPKPAAKATMPTPKTATKPRAQLRTPAVQPCMLATPNPIRPGGTLACNRV